MTGTLLWLLVVTYLGSNPYTTEDLQRLCKSPTGARVEVHERLGTLQLGEHKIPARYVECWEIKPDKKGA